MSPTSEEKSFTIVEASISSLRHALETGQITCLELISLYLHRIATFDRRKNVLNSIPMLNPAVFEEAAKSDGRRAKGLPLGPLEGIPFTVKDSFKVKGMAVASGSPAFKSLVASEDAFTVERLRKAGAILVGKTNMPPMAAGGMQRGVYGRAESPYNPEYLTAAFASGSSNGSATSTAASFAAFGMGEETVSSGRSPASNNGLVAYTPSRGLISIRGNWPLYPTCDVVVPHARTMDDLFEILDVTIAKDEKTAGDFWRDQPFVKMPDPEMVRPPKYSDLADPLALKGKIIGVPKIYINAQEFHDHERPIKTRDSIIQLWKDAKTALESLGAIVVEVEFPLISKYDTVTDAAGLTPEWNATERCELVGYAWDDFLKDNADPNCPSLSEVGWRQIFPAPAGALADRYKRSPNAPLSFENIVDCVKHGRKSIAELPGIKDALETLEKQRKRDFESWMDEMGLDLLVFPANADVGKADSDTNEASATHAWQNGVMYSNGNRVWRHLGIPSVTVTMGIMQDAKIPVGLTFISKAYEDNNILRYAFAYEQVSKKREAPRSTPILKTDIISLKPERKLFDHETGKPELVVYPPVKTAGVDQDHFVLSGKVSATDSCGLQSLTIHVDGQLLYEDFEIKDSEWKIGRDVVKMSSYSSVHPSAREVNKATIAIVMVKSKCGKATAKMLMID